ncbi:hypothetical protein Taro_036210 [Colocasia esculenta]|uniref:Auxin-responsive protein n=1 Tax=Colocasia esculenta TaxID=4460 RepID=A0A843WKZ8_COLES|nr:hypothetical protein [Colocasia esculenta]
MPSSVLSSDSMHIGLLAAAAHAAATNSRFTIFYNPRASSSEFVIPLAKYVKAVYHTRVSVGMRFRMLFETEESSVRRYMGTITGVGDLNPVHWPNSHWRSVKVGWDESTAGERHPRVSLWEIEPLTTFPMYPPPFSLGLKRPWPSGLPSLHAGKDNDLSLSSLLWLRDGNRGIQSLNFQRTAAAVQQMRDVDPSKQSVPAMLLFQQSQSIPSGYPPISPSQIPHQLQPIPLQQQQPRPQQLPEQQQQKQFVDHQQIPAVVSALSQLASTSQSQFPTSQVVSSFCQQQNFPDSNGNVVTASALSPLHGIMGNFTPEETSHLLNLERSSSLIPSGSWSNKRVAVEPLISSGVQNVMPTLRNVMNVAGPAAVPFSGYLSAAETDLLLNPAVTHSSCLDESGFLQSSDNVGQDNPHNKTFVKVYKSGSFGRSLDITRFNNYPELRGELGRMFGLEGQLEDPLRSGWQLVFVDGEGDVLLVGDDPWQEFVNSVSCIKILSPLDVQKMGKQGVDFQNMAPIKRLSGNSCDDYASHQDPRKLSTKIPSVGSLDY